jgi:hypothetical protein
MYLLSDVLVIGSKKKSYMSGKVKLTLHAFYKWADITIYDIKDASKSLTSVHFIANTIQISMPPETFSFRAETVEEKRDFLIASRKIKKEVHEKLQQEKEANRKLQQQHSQTSLGSMDDGYAPNVPFVKEVKKSTDVFKTKKIPVEDEHFLMELPDELEVMIFSRDFTESVQQIVRGKRIDTIDNLANQLFQDHASHFTNEPMSLIKRRIDVQTDKLSTLLCMELANPEMHRENIKRNINLLLDLGLDEQARDIFLSARTVTIRRRIK